jgi:hypothetical protein
LQLQKRQFLITRISTAIFFVKIASVNAASFCLYFRCRGDWWFVELRNCFDLQYWIEREEFFSSLKSLGSFSSDSPSQLDILWHDGHTFGVNGAQVGVLKESDQVSLTGLLESADGCALEPEISFEVLSNFSHKTLEG